MKVWRLEDVHHHGFYRAAGEHLDEDEAAEAAESAAGVGPWPMPYQDGMSFLTVINGNAFGFRSPGDLIRWFGKNSDPLRKAGVCVTVWDVPDEAVDVGGHQVAYDWREAKLVQVSTVEEFFASEGVKA